MQPQEGGAEVAALQLSEALRGQVVHVLLERLVGKLRFLRRLHHLLLGNRGAFWFLGGRELVNCKT